jgi:phosphoribosylamine--glycine ligase
MRVLVVGGGGREHALVHSFAQSPLADRIFCAPGNAGTAAEADNVPIAADDLRTLLDFASREEVDLTVIGPEAPLVVGLTDLFEEHGLAVFGPNKEASQLEGSKVFAKEIMAAGGVATGAYRRHERLESALLDIEGRGDYPLVVKADGLAAGKGVVVADDRAAAGAAVAAAMEQRQFGAAGDRLVLEECLTGPEVSFFAISDGRRAIPAGTAQDHKRIFDGDQGPNTGGMGAFAPSPLVNAALSAQIMREIVDPVIAGMRSDGHEYRGFLYVGLMLTCAGPKVIEFNVRFGDPEAQVVLPMLDEDLAWLLGEAATGALPSRPARFRREPHVGVVLAAAGYPDASETGKAIDGLAAASDVPGAIVFHAGTAMREGRLVTAGGRVLTVVGRSTTFKDAIDTAYAAASRIHFDGMQYRRDIGRKALSV